VNLQVSKARLLGLVILDACRNNPFAAKMQRSLRTRAVPRGLAPMEPTDNVLVAYAARDGTTANDGDGRNSPFTAALLHNIETPGLEISFLFRNVRDEVMAATKREQQPFVYGSLSKEAIYLKPLPVSASPKAPAAAEVTAPAEDEQFWQAIKTSTVPGLYEEFLKRYPTTSHLFEARERLVDLRSKQVASVAPQTVDSSRKTVDKTGSPEDSRSQNPNDVIEQKRNLYTPEDAQRVAAMGAQHELKMPAFSIGTTKSDVPNSYRQFVGVWSSKVGSSGGKGRQAMLIVTEAYSDGLVLGFYLYGPPTKYSWEKDTPAGYTAVLGRVSDGTLRFESGLTPIEARLVGTNAMSLQSTNPRKRSEISTINLAPIWQLVPTDPTARGKLPGDRNESTPAARKKTTESSLSPDERKTNPPKPQNSKDSTQALYAQCSAEGHRLTGSKHTNVGFSRIEACARNGGKM
jgi:uncharacterized caspase-like protein